MPSLVKREARGRGAVRAYCWQPHYWWPLVQQHPRWLLIHGVQPGPLLIQEHPEVFWGVVASMYIGNVALLVLNFPLVGLWISLLRIPQPLLCALILIFMLVGTYSMNNSMLDLLFLVVKGIIGYVLRKLKFDVSPMIVAIVLGPMIERTFRQSLFMTGGDFSVFTSRPITVTILLILLAIFILRPHMAPGSGKAAASQCSYRQDTLLVASVGAGVGNKISEEIIHGSSFGVSIH